MGILGVVDPETGQQRYVNTSSRKLREQFHTAAAERSRSVQQSIRSAGATYLELSTQRDWLGDMVTFVAGQRSAATRTRTAPSTSGQVSR